METMRFHWEDVTGNKGSFTVEASTVEACIKSAENETRGEGVWITDYYSI
ncbi:hypothetical protein KGR20_23040 [Cytobacillus oceanisediminis]|nr:hypothetical protein [Cytobacillus oceanisediminis]MBZ9536817.1 hypothetical protein [Cytobacillus oceanisediminis]MBZ9537038.1 hypothetical protein [Cytobacillus oceanisediminis]